MQHDSRQFLNIGRFWPPRDSAAGHASSITPLTCKCICCLCAGTQLMNAFTCVCFAWGGIHAKQADDHVHDMGSSVCADRLTSSFISCGSRNRMVAAAFNCLFNTGATLSAGINCATCCMHQLAGSATQNCRNITANRQCCPS